MASNRWEGCVSAEGKTDRDRQLMSRLSGLVQEMDAAQMDAYCAAVDGWVDRWQDKIDVARKILET